MRVLAVRIVRSGSFPRFLPLAFAPFVRDGKRDLTRNAAMTASRVKIGFASIMVVQLYPDQHILHNSVYDFPTRSV